MTELLVILVVALLVIGPKRLPDLARTIGRTLRDFKKATSDFEDSIDIDPVEEHHDSDITEEKNANKKISEKNQEGNNSNQEK